MPSKNLAAQNDSIEIRMPRDLVGLLAAGMGEDSAALAAIEFQVEHYEGSFVAALLTKVDDDTRVSSLAAGEAGWEAAGAWRSVRVVRTDANGGDCFAYLSVR